MNYKNRAKVVHMRLVRKGMFAEAGRLMRALSSNTNSISLGICDTDWNLSLEFGMSGKSLIRIK